jgi:Zn-finger nucleic acid-binding protein
MTPVEFEGVTVDRCTSCGGLWFDALEHTNLKRKEGSESLDTGDPDVGRTHDAKAVVLCPVDGQRMVRMVDVTQPHIWLESCPACGGVFFDAGEFRDFKERTWMEFLLRRARHRRL